MDGAVMKDLPLFMQERIVNCAKVAHAHDFVSRFADGYDTHVGERGVRLSGGEKQRIAIARALMTKPSLLVLDEATSALDAVSENSLKLEEIGRDRTMIVIAHRLSTVLSASQIMVVQNGSIVETGNHKELLEKEGVYADLVAHQLTR